MAQGIAVHPRRKKRIIEGYKELRDGLDAAGKRTGELREYAAAWGLSVKTIQRWIRKERTGPR